MEPPVDEAPFPEEQEPQPNQRKSFPFGVPITEKMMGHFDVFRCPFALCFGKCRDEDRGMDIDNLVEKEFTCKKNADHRWKFVHDVEQGMIKTTGHIEPLGWSSEFRLPEEPDIERPDRDE